MRFLSVIAATVVSLVAADAAAQVSPQADASPPPSTWNSVPMFVTGASVGGAGLLMGVGGVVWLDQQNREESDDGGVGPSDLVEGLAAYSLIGFGGAMVLTGIPLMIVGALPADPDDEDAAALVPRVEVGPASFVATWTF
ncbi:MAG: hypothetical protein AAGA56_18725 [Myxococcota bacterium]